MHLPRLCRPRSLLISICTFALSFLVLLNLMLNQLQYNERNSRNDFQNPKHVQQNGYEVDFEFENYVAKGNRKPKAANDKNLNEVKHVKPDPVLKQKSSKNGKFNFKFQQDKDNLEINHSENNNNYDSDYLVDINSVVIEEDDYDDDENEDDDDENEGDTRTFRNQRNQIKHKIRQKGLENPIFEPKDFVNLSKLIFTKPPLRYAEVNRERDLNVLKFNNQLDGKYLKPEDITDGIYWSVKAESLVPKGFSVNESEEYIKSVHKQDVKNLQPSTWKRCGRPKNGFVILQDETAMCARYRDPHTKFVLGELLSYYLSHLLGMDNIPAVALSWTNSTSSKWRAAKIHSLEWKDGNVVALIQWIPNMDTMNAHVKIPQMIYKSYKTGVPITVKSIHNSSLMQRNVSELIQWGSMIIFDYLTGNYDRVASMQDAVEKEKKPGIILENIRNLRRSTKTRKLWLIDNESGLFDAYELLYKGGRSGTRFIRFHKEMLQTMCVFQKNVADAIFQLAKLSEPHKVLEEFARSRESLLNEVPNIYNKNTYTLFHNKFRHRLSEVQEWIRHCQSLSVR